MPQNMVWFWAALQWWPIVLWVHRAALRGRLGGSFGIPWKQLFLSGFMVWGASSLLAVVVLAASIWPSSLCVWGEVNICLHKTEQIHHSFLPGHIKHEQKPQWERLLRVQALHLQTITHTSKHLEKTYQSDRISNFGAVTPGCFTFHW